MNVAEKLSSEFGIEKKYVDNIIALIDEGNTIPFIARYRKEKTNSCDDQILREFADRLRYLNNLEERKEEIAAAIEEQGKMTDEIRASLSGAETMTEAEDIYRPFKQKKKTRASIATEKGLGPLAEIILAQEIRSGSVFDIAAEYINEEKGVPTAEAALQGASDIIAEIISDDAELRKIIREYVFANGTIVTRAAVRQSKTEKPQDSKVRTRTFGENETKVFAEGTGGTARTSVKTKVFGEEGIGISSEARSGGAKADEASTKTRTFGEDGPRTFAEGKRSAVETAEGKAKSDDGKVKADEGKAKSARAAKISDEKIAEKMATYEMYAEYSEPVSKIPSHRILAINRGEKEGCLRVFIEVDEGECIFIIANRFITKESVFSEIIRSAAADSFTRLVFPSIEREIRNELTDKADEQAIKMFEVNLRPLLLQPPLKGKVVLALDPAYRTGCKIAVINERGDVLDTTVVYPTPPQSKTEESERKLLALIRKHKVDVISIGNGTASKEAEIFVADMIKKADRKVSYAIVNEAGASVYSASKLGAEEFPEYDVSLRSAVSIGRRLQDPLAELIKIDVKSIGVGQYQHDMPQARLTEVLGGVVEDCVNSVGVDLNTASVSLLTFVAGLNAGIARNIVEYRKSKPFTDRKQLLDVNKLGPKAFEQCAGFLRVIGGKNLLDNTGVHPESYGAVRILLSELDIREDDIGKPETRIKEKAEAYGMKKLAEKCGTGIPTLTDIISELGKPGRDIRDSLPQPVLRSDLLGIENLSEGTELDGVVRNVTDFGVFVDIGVHQDGLVHITQISNGFVKHPSEVLGVGDRVKVRVIGVDTAKNKISLSLKTSDRPGGIAAPERGSRKSGENGFPKKAEESLDDKLKALQRRFSGK